MEEKPFDLLVFIPKDKMNPEPLQAPMQWPTDTMQEDTATPTVFRKTFTLKIPQKTSHRFRSLFRRKAKVPRKLKKAFKHIEMEHRFVDRISESEFKVSTTVYVNFKTKAGYPQTNWVRRAIGKANSGIEKKLKEEILPNNDRP